MHVIRSADRRPCDQIASVLALIEIVLVGLGCCGIGLVLSGIAGRPVPPPVSPQLPDAKISDGRGFPDPPRSKRSLGKIVGGTLLIGFVAVCAWTLYALSHWDMKFGRPLRIRNRIWIGPRRRGAGCNDGARPALDGLGSWQRAWLGERWLAAARTEHASVPAFERLAVQLAHIEAPAALIDRCHDARADEIRHARRCFTLARAYSGVPWTGAALPTPEASAVDLPALAIESLHEGCIGEGVAADLAAAAAARSSDPVVASSLAMIAGDEARHAELAWSIIELCLARGGAPVRRALARESPDSPLPTGGPVQLSRRERRRLAAVRSARVRARLATLLAACEAALPDARS